MPHSLNIPCYSDYIEPFSPWSPSVHRHAQDKLIFTRYTPFVPSGNRVFVSLLVDQYDDPIKTRAVLIDIDVKTLKKDEELFKTINETFREQSISRSDIQPIDFQISNVCYVNNG